MTSLMKTIVLLLVFGIVLSIATVYHLSNNIAYTNNVEKGAVELQSFRHRREIIKPATTRCCKLNQYYDQEEGRCLGVPGGGKVLHVENERSCGINVLKPHCRSSLYYYICKHGKSILAQCLNGQIFDNRLQRCVLSVLTPSTIRPDDHKYYDHVRVPNCARPGRFPVPGYCFMYYVCQTNGHRLYQNVFKCPQNMGYRADRQVCAGVPNCENKVDSTVCVPDAPGEESLSIDEVTEENIERTSGTSEESKAANENDSAAKEEEDVNFKMMVYDGTSTTPVSVISNPLSVDNYEDNYSNTDNASTNNANTLSAQAIEDVSIPDNVSETSMPNQTPNPTENTQEALDEVQDGGDVLSMTELDNDAPHFSTTTRSEYSTNLDVNSNFDSETTDTAPSPSTSYTLLKSDEETSMPNQPPNPTESTQEAPDEVQDEGDVLSVTELDNDTPHFITTMSSAKPDYRTNADLNSNFNSETADTAPFPSTSNTLLKSDEETQDITTEQYKGDDEILSRSNTEPIDQDLTSKISNVPESSSIGETQDATTEQYRHNEDSSVTLPYSNVEAVNQDSTSAMDNVAEYPSISDTPSKIDEEMQDVTTEQYRNNEDSTVTLSYTDTKAIDPTSRVNNMSESFSTSDTPPILNEETQDVTTEQYRNYDRTLPNSDAELVEQSPISTLTDIPPITDSLNRNDFNTPLSTTIPTILPSQAAVNDDEHIMGELPETSPIYDKSADADLLAE